MDSTSDTAFEIRIDPTTGRKVLIAEGRALRPNDFVGDTQQSSHAGAHCPFCRGHEHETPRELAVVHDSQGEWQIRVVPNKYPAVSAAGVHEVIIESPRHITDWSELSTDEITAVLQVFRARIAHAYTNHGIRSALLFKNVGQGAGASLEHLHSQLIALPFVPEVLETELAVAAEFQSQAGECLMCGLLAKELTEESRLVLENEHFAVFCAYAGRQPYETWIVPKVHAHDFQAISVQESAALAAILRELVRRLRTHLSLLAYNLLLHTAPVGDERQAAFHWHWELIPRSTSLAGFEWGTGMHINSVSPERAAIRLRASKSGEEVPIQ